MPVNLEVLPTGQRRKDRGGPEKGRRAIAIGYARKTRFPGRVRPARRSHQGEEPAAVFAYQFIAVVR